MVAVKNFLTQRTNNFWLRVASSFVLAPLVLYITYRGGVLYTGLVVSFIALAFYEWARLVCTKKQDFTPINAALFALGFIYLSGGGVALLALRDSSEGWQLTFYLLAVVWGTDIGAYAVGRTVGGPKLAPKISPKKTWSGLFGGMALAALFGYLATELMGGHGRLMAVLIALTLAVVAQLGDLLKSALKRRAGVKDSGAIIPGHGGVLDRIDGLIAAAIFLALYEMDNVAIHW